MLKFILDSDCNDRKKQEQHVIASHLRPEETKQLSTALQISFTDQ